MKKPVKTVTVRLEREEYEALSRIAREQGRFVSRQAQWWIRKALREQTRREQEKGAAL